MSYAGSQLAGGWRSRATDCRAIDSKMGGSWADGQAKWLAVGSLLAVALALPLRLARGSRLLPSSCRHRRGLRAARLSLRSAGGRGLRGEQRKAVRGRRHSGTRLRLRLLRRQPWSPAVRAAASRYGLDRQCWSEGGGGQLPRARGRHRRTLPSVFWCPPACVWCARALVAPPRLLGVVSLPFVRRATCPLDSTSPTSLLTSPACTLASLPSRLGVARASPLPRCRGRWRATASTAE